MIQYQGQLYEVNDVSKAMPIKKFRKFVQEATKVEAKKQLLTFGGKMFHDDCDLCDYRVEHGYTINLLSREPLAEMPVASKSNNNEELPSASTANNNEETKELSKEEQKERLREIGAIDLIDELETEESNQKEEICKRCKNNDAKKCKVRIFIRNGSI